MATFQVSSLYFYALISIPILLLTIFFFVLVLAPSQYDPYSPELVNATQEDDSGQSVSIDPDQFYGRFSGVPDNVKFALKKETSVQIVVLGDIGRSPRMQYHALSLAKHGARVDLIGFVESEPHPSLLTSPHITLRSLRPPPTYLQTTNRTLFPLLAPLKVLWQTLNLYHTLSRCKPAQYLLVQNPPSIPVLAIAKLICLLRNQKLIIDWHNFGWSILALKLGASHPLVLIAKMYEHLFARTADVHFAVTRAMAELMKREIGVVALPLHDRPAAAFQPLAAPADRGAVLRRLEHTAAHAEQIERGDWKLIVSSTSWTADEDFSLFLSALVGYCKHASASKRNESGKQKQKQLPYILAIITGKGPLLAHYLGQIATLQQSNQLPCVTIATAWYSTSDYAALLSAADLGVSLHMSSSGVDLPMKVVDMFGAGLPVVGYSKYESWGELVREGENGRGFGDAAGLEKLLVELFGEGNKGGLERIRKGAVEEGARRWDEEWDGVAGRGVFRVC